MAFYNVLHIKISFFQEIPSNEWVIKSRTSPTTGKLERCESTAWREVAGKSKTLMLYMWKKPAGFTDSRQASFDVDAPPDGVDNESFDNEPGDES